ncbi:helix-turn-helix transcriptional regulator [Sinomicrobium sp. M5D2P17]
MDENEHIEKERLEHIFFVLNEMKLGNLSYRLRLSLFDEGYDTIVTYINELQDIMTQLVRNRAGTAQGLYREVHMTFVLDDDFHVKQVNDVVLDILNTEQEQIHCLFFDELLTDEYRMVWDILEDEVFPLLDSPFSFGVSFQINDMVECPAYCRFTRNTEDRLIRVSAPKVFAKPSIEGFMNRPLVTEDAKKDLKPATGPEFSGRISPRETEEEKAVREMARYIEEHLDAPWPSINKLAKDSGMNREKLRILFKRLFQTTLYDFYTDKRMEKAKHLLVHTDMAIEEIALVLGYKASSNFYKTFKKKYGGSPGEIRKKR